MLRKVIAVIALLCCSAAPVNAQTPTLKFAFFTSDQDVNWVRVIKPFIDAVNADPSGAVKIEAYPNGALGRALPQQPQLILDGVADIAWIVPSLSSGRFPDDTVFEVPGLFTGIREGVKVYSDLISANAMRGYGDYVALGSFTNANLNVYSRKPIKALKDLNGLKARILGPVVGQTVKSLGMVPILLPPNEVVEALGRSTIDAVTTVPSALIDFGMDRVTSHDYLIELGTNSFAVLISRAKFDALPQAARDVLMKYSGRWLNDLYVKQMEAYNQDLIRGFEADSKRTVVKPSPADMTTAQSVFAEVTKEWSAKSAENEKILAKAKQILSDYRTAMQPK